MVWVRASVVALLDALADGEDQHLSSELYKRDNWVPNHTFLCYGWKFALQLWTLLSEEALLW